MISVNNLTGSEVIVRVINKIQIPVDDKIEIKVIFVMSFRIFHPELRRCTCGTAILSVLLYYYYWIFILFFTECIDTRVFVVCKAVTDD